MKIATYLSSALFLLSGNYLQAHAPLMDGKSNSHSKTHQAQKFSQYTDQIIVKLKTAKAYDQVKFIKLAEEATGKIFTHVRSFSDGFGHVIKLGEMASLEEMNDIALSLKEINSSIQYVKADTRMFPMATTPNDEFFANRQWNLQSSATQGLNLPAAWDFTTGSSDVVVAVLDTGVLKDHVGFDSTRLLDGFDMVSANNVDGAFTKSGDGDGQDSDPNDEGNWVTNLESTDGAGEFFGCTETSSTWHGTHVAGIIGAASNDGNGDGSGGGISGIDWNTKILPVRVLGKCGGYTSDIIDGIRWAAGLEVTGITTNSNPADVINMSFGTVNACDITLQSAIDDARTAGSVVVVAAGNDSALAIDSTPANCENVIVVAAHDQNGELSTSSNSGVNVDVIAPGGNTATTCNDDSQEAIYSLGDGGTQMADLDNSYICHEGSSMAAAHVSGVASLMLAGNPSLTPDEIETAIKQTARSFVGGTTCETNNDTCGIGIVDAASAIASAIAPSDLTMENVDYDIQFTWQDNSQIETGFKIERSVDSGDFEDVATIATNITTYLDENVQDLATTLYRVSAIKGEAVSESVEITVTDQALAPASNLIAQEVTNNQVKLTWLDASNSELGYQIDRSDNDKTNFKRLHITSANISAYTDASLIDGTHYFYKIQTITESGLNDAIEEIEIFTNISEPTFLTGRASSSQISLSWVDNAATETGFKVERSIDGVNYSQIASVTSDITAYTDNTVSGSSFYYYRVKAYKDSNDSESVYSEITSLSTPSSTKGAGSVHWYLLFVLLFLLKRSYLVKLK